jgi:hypothetical protein
VSEGIEITLARIIQVISRTPPSACPHCNGLGVAIRENARGQLYEWPCVAQCPPPLIGISVNARRR